MELILAGAAYIGVAVALSLLGLFVVRRLVSHHVLAAHNDVAGFIYATIAVTYAVVLGFVVITVWEQHDEARGSADREANAVADLYRLAQWFPEDGRAQIHATLTDYARSVVDEEWPAMDAGAAPSASTEAALDRLWSLYGGIIPGPGVQETAHDGSIDRLQELGDARRERLLASAAGIPGILWLGLIAGGVITVAFAYTFGVERGQSHALLLATLAASVALLLFVIASLNHPFRGGIRVEPEAMEMVLRQVAGLA